MISDDRRRDKKVKEKRCHKEGRYPIALAHERTMGSASPSLIGFFMGLGGRIPPLLDAFARRVASSFLGLTILSCTRDGSLYEIRIATRSRRSYPAALQEL